MENRAMNLKRSTLTTVVLLLLASLLSAGPALAQNLEAPGANNRSALPQQQGQGPTDPAELEAFMDRLFAEHMREHHIAGAAVSVVKDGELFFAKGYGYADLEAGTPVDPERTGFRIGSVSKLFAWTAVMQLVEQGVLDLDADVNTYLDFRIPDTYPQPITLKHLLTHTSGFESVVYEMLTRDVNDLVPARERLVSHMPARVRPPGDYAGYSNYNADLAGYIVARVSGMPYEQVIQSKILEPLGMAHTSVGSSGPPELVPLRSVGYTYTEGAFQIVPDYFAQPGIVPGAAIRSSAADMARFMIAHLQEGRYGETRILQEATAQQMHSPLFTPDPRISGNAHGFFDFSDNGQWTIGHGGGAPPMSSLLLLLPDQNLGVFVNYNSEGGGDLTNQHLGFQRAFYDHYYPALPAASIEPPADFAARAGRFAGSYRYTQVSYTTQEKLLGLFTALKISDSGDGALIFATPYGEWRFVEVEPLYFRQADGELALVFREDERGRITHMFANLTPMWAFEKLRWYETPGFHIGLALGSIVFFLSAIVALAIRAASIRLNRNRRRGGAREAVPRGARVAGWILLGISVLNVLFLVGTMLWGDLNTVFGVSLIYRLVLALPVLAAVLTVAALVYTVLAWKDRFWGLAGRVHYTLVTVAAVAFVWFLNYWNLLGWRF
jgi:CubicO group peptidase (beta-lactamase class C family)